MLFYVAEINACIYLFTFLRKLFGWFFKINMYLNNRYLRLYFLVIEYFSNIGC